MFFSVSRCLCVFGFSVYFLIVPVTPSGERLKGSIFSADGA